MCYSDDNMPQKPEALRTLTTEEMVEMAKGRKISHKGCPDFMPTDVFGVSNERAIWAKTICPACGKLFFTFPDSPRWIPDLSKK